MTTYSLPSLAEMRGETITADDLLRVAKRAATLELRGAQFSTDDRLDVASAIVCTVLAESDGHLPGIGSPRVTLTRCCNLARTARRSIQRQRDRDSVDAQTTADAEPETEPDTPAEHAAIVGQSGAQLAALAADAVTRDLGLSVDRASGTWAVFYGWARGESGEICAAERNVAHGTWRVRSTRGAKIVRDAYSAADLISRLTLGAREATDDAPLTYVLRDDSRKARDRTRCLSDVDSAPHWRTPSYSRPDTVEDARIVCTVSHVAPQPTYTCAISPDARLHADAATIGRLSAALRIGRRAEQPTATTSDLPTLALAAE